MARRHSPVSDLNVIQAVLGDSFGSGPWNRFPCSAMPVSPGLKRQQIHRDPGAARLDLLPGPKEALVGFSSIVLAESDPDTYGIGQTDIHGHAASGYSRMLSGIGISRRIPARIGFIGAMAPISDVPPLRAIFYRKSAFFGHLKWHIVILDFSPSHCRRGCAGAFPATPSPGSEATS